MENEDTIRGLRNFADFLEQNPEFQLVFLSTSVNIETKEELAKWARTLGRTEKQDFGVVLSLRHKFSDTVWLDLDISREKVCKKVVTGTRVVPAKPATPEMTVEDYKWVCDEPILATSSEA